jgi:hypothetical protein
MQKAAKITLSLQWETSAGALMGKDDDSTSSWVRAVEDWKLATRMS